MEKLIMFIQYVGSKSGVAKYKVLIIRENEIVGEFMKNVLTVTELKTIGIEVFYNGWKEWVDLSTVLKVIEYCYKTTDSALFKQKLLAIPEFVAFQRKERIKKYFETRTPTHPTGEGC